MKNYIAVVKSTDGGLDKYQDFDTQPEANAHVATYGGFVVPDPGGSIDYWVVDEAAETVVNDQAQADADALGARWKGLRATRNALLADNDWTQLADSPLADEVKVEWAAYRQELRDLPATTEDIFHPIWPESP